MERVALHGIIQSPPSFLQGDALSPPRLELEGIVSMSNYNFKLNAVVELCVSLPGRLYQTGETATLIGFDLLPPHDQCSCA
jgi:hypothetical protein